MNIAESQKTRMFTTTNVTKESFFKDWLDGKTIKITEGSFTKELRIEQTMKEDGGGNRILFKAYIVSAGPTNGRKSIVINSPQTGYVDFKDQSGWIKSTDQITW